ncbi:MAG: DUF4062 domain-containing protein, partial [Nitrospirae bacterium]|nr:DUF4062 domain-containing protein [Nitrospirota bacterium]
MKILISSTYEDLKEYREAVIETLLRMEKHFSAMEYFGS